MSEQIQRRMNRFSKFLWRLCLNGWDHHMWILLSGKRGDSCGCSMCDMALLLTQSWCVQLAFLEDGSLSYMMNLSGLPVTLAQLTGWCTFFRGSGILMSTLSLSNNCRQNIPFFFQFHQLWKDGQRVEFYCFSPFRFHFFFQQIFIENEGIQQVLSWRNTLHLGIHGLEQEAIKSDKCWWSSIGYCCVYS